MLQLVSNDWNFLIDNLSDHLTNPSIEGSYLVLPKDLFLKYSVIRNVLSKKKVLLGTKFLLADRFFQQICGSINHTNFCCELYSRVKEHGSLSELSEQQLVSLINRLALLFTRIELYGLDGHLEEWQDKLFEEICEKSFQDPLFIKNKEIFLFGFSYIPPLYYRALQKLSSHSNVIIYRFSYTESFWEPDELEAHPLLLRFGMLHKEFEKIYLDSGEIKSHYRKHSESSLLSHLKNDILSGEVTRYSTASDDNSIEIIEVPLSKYREVELLYDKISHLILDEKYLAEDILVLAPDMEQYGSYIEAIFKKIPYNLKIKNSSAIYNFLTLAQIISHSDNLHNLIKLVEIMAFEKMLLVDELELDKIKGWIKTFYCNSDLPTLIKNITKATIFEREIENTDFVLLGRLVEILDSLQQDSAFIEQERDINQWMLFLNSLYSKYLAQNSAVEFSSLFRSVDLTTVISFELLISICKRYSPTKRMAYRLNGLNFSSMDSGSIEASKVIFIIGVEAGALPGKECNIFNYRVKAPSRIMFDKDIFLQTICSAGDRLIFTHRYFCQEEGKAVAPSTFLSELENFCLSSYGHKINRIRSCPDSTSATLFSEQGESFSLINYRASQAKRQEWNIKKVPFFIDPYDHIDTISYQTHIDHFSMRSWIKDPLRNHFTLYQPDYGEGLNSLLNFSHLDNFLLLDNALKNSGYVEGDSYQNALNIKKRRALYEIATVCRRYDLDKNEIKAQSFDMKIKNSYINSFIDNCIQNHIFLSSKLNIFALWLDVLIFSHINSYGTVHLHSILDSSSVSLKLENVESQLESLLEYYHLLLISPSPLNKDLVTAFHQR